MKEDLGIRRHLSNRPSKPATGFLERHRSRQTYLGECKVTQTTRGDMQSSETARTLDEPEAPPSDALTVYFDGSCALCTAEIDYYSSRRGSEVLRFVDVSSEAAQTGPGLERGVAMRRFHVRRPDGALLSGAAAFAAIWEVLPGWRLAGRLARWRPVAILLETGYRAFLPVRPAISRLARVITARERGAR
jgi:predicted DCC family thiol-disulfide oxidoreductase YuxK